MRAAFFLFFSFLSIPVSFAHTGGLSFERQIKDVLIDIGFGTDIPTVGSAPTYSFDLFNTADPNAYAFEPFSKVHVRVFKDRQELLSRTLENNGLNVPFLSFQYKEAGDYSMAVKFERKGKDSVDASFGYRVMPAPTPSLNVSSDMTKVILGVIAALILFLSYRLFVAVRA